MFARPTTLPASRTSRSQERSGRPHARRERHVADGVGDEVWTLATAILAADRSLIIVDWSLKSEGIATASSTLGSGLVELLKGTATFEEVIAPVLGTDVHMIPAGNGKGDAGDDIDVGRVADVLDALDGVYDHIIVVARTAPRRRLRSTRRPLRCRRRDGGCSALPSAAMASPGSFLGFEVESFDVAVYVPFGPANSDASPALPKAG